MKRDYKEEQKYVLAKQRMEKIKGFYHHLTSYVLINIFISCVIIFGLMKDNGNNFSDAMSNFGVYSVWVFWGIGLFFHWVGVFGQNLFFSKSWEDRKVQEYMKNNKF